MRRFSGKGVKLLNINPRNWVCLAAARATGEGKQCQGQGTMPAGNGGRWATNTTTGVVRWCARSEITFLAVNLSRFARPPPSAGKIMGFTIPAKTPSLLSCFWLGFLVIFLLQETGLMVEPGIVYLRIMVALHATCKNMSWQKGCNTAG